MFSEAQQASLGSLLGSIFSILIYRTHFYLQDRNRKTTVRIFNLKDDLERKMYVFKNILVLKID